MARLTRRTALFGTGALALAGIGVLATRPEELGAMHDPYFNTLAQALKRAGLMRPTLVIDRTRLDANIAALRRSTDAAKLPLRIVAKSLPAPGLLERVRTGMASERLMVFSAQMLLQLLDQYPRAEWLMGKPLPAAEFARVARQAGPDAAGRVQWLIDTPARLAEYAEVARAGAFVLRANLEIDVGLHRGGLVGGQAVAEVAKQAAALGVTVSGLMGYDPHIPKMPTPDKAFAASQSAYREAIEALRAAGIADPSRLTLNTAGSPTVRRHCRGTVANEVSVGSAFVKPGDFELDDLADLQPAAWIATPVIKASADQALPGVEALSGAMHWWDRNTQRGFFIHGGHWLAKPASPQGLQYSQLFGRSSNQELLTGSNRIGLKPNDIIFLRPDQSEALFLQFGDLAVFDGDGIAEFWPTLPISA